MSHSRKTNQNPSPVNKYPEKIPFMEGRPERDLAIKDNDIANLLIALNTCKSLDEFLSRV